MSPNRMRLCGALCASLIAVPATATGIAPEQPADTSPGPGLGEQPPEPQQGAAADPRPVDASDIIVTARRRNETAQNTPVPITVLSDALLQRYAIKGVASVAQFTPGFIAGEAGGAVGGGLSLRGIGSGESQPFIDQAISINVDGIQISTAQILRAAQLDLKQIEILRGPQALFFGKNSPGGIISLTSAEPGSRTELIAQGGYEFKAEEKYLDLTFSTPVTETLGVRVAGHYSKMNGYINLRTPAVAGVTPLDLKAFPRQEEAFVRGTIVYTPSDRLKVRVKATHINTRLIGSGSFFNDVIACPYGGPQGPIPLDNCRNDGVVFAAGLPASFLALSPLLSKDPRGGRRNKQTLITGLIDYKLGDKLTLSSVSGYYGIDERATSNASAGLSGVLGFGTTFSLDQYTQELRLASSFDGPINVLIGGFAESRKLSTATFIGVPSRNIALPTEATSQRQRSYSAFGQILWDVADRVQLTAGGRYSEETKKLLNFVVTAPGGPPVDVSLDPRYPDTTLKFHNFSPEITTTYKPVQDVMLFASYKRGFKSGGFDAAFTSGAILSNPARGQAFRPEKVKGFEGGIKSTIADRQLTLNLTGYYYDYTDLQVSTFDNVAHVFTTQNAAKSRIKGIEFETAFRPRGVPGFNLHAAGAYNDAKFISYLADCYTGQSQALGCNRVLNDLTGRFTSQDVSGRRPRKAPKWSITGGAYYEHPVSSGLMFSVATDLLYSSGYIGGFAFQPLSYQSAFAKLDATARLYAQDSRWELAVIGRNLTNKRTLVGANDRNGTGGGKGGLTTCSTVTQTGCDKLADITGVLDRPRTVAVQLTFRY